jgi:hypothetical protein
LSTSADRILAHGDRHALPCIGRIDGVTSEQTAKSIDPRTFWGAIGKPATGSTIVTAQSAAGPAGFLGLSATHLTTDPLIHFAGGYLA